MKIEVSEEWGPWIDHDGKGCPCIGAYVHVIYRDGMHRSGIAGSEGGRSWYWSPIMELNWDIIAFRIRKPRALLDMIERARELDVPEGPVQKPSKVPA